LNIKRLGERDFAAGCYGTIDETVTLEDDEDLYFRLGRLFDL
jgi:hypothetical protein